MKGCEMNSNQRVVIFVGLLIEASMLLLPPWKGGYGGYHPFFTTPPNKYITYSSEGGFWSFAYIDLKRLGFQCAIVAILTIGTFVLFGDKKNKS
jgi:hypothetical protein